MHRIASLNLLFELTELVIKILEQELLVDRFVISVLRKELFELLRLFLSFQLGLESG